MNILRIILLCTLIPVRVLEDEKDVVPEVYQYPDNFISDSVPVLPISYGQYIYYTTFINHNVSTTEYNSSPCCSIKRRDTFLPICLLLCGDIEICPGPCDASPESSSSENPDFKVFKDVVCTFYM